MKKTYMVEFELPETLTEEFLALIPQQRYMINNLLAAGTMKAYSLAMDRSKLWAVLAADSEIEYLYLYMLEPSFHNTVHERTIHHHLLFPIRKCSYRHKSQSVR